MLISKPVLRYPGGKFTNANWVIGNFPAHETYVELFGGAASILMRKQKSRGEVYNDIDSDVVNVFRVLRDRKQAAELQRLIELTPFSYDELARAFDETDDPIEAARRMIYRSFAGIASDSIHRKHAGFRGLKNKNSGVTAGTEWSHYSGHIAAFTSRLRDVTIENRDYERIIRLYNRPNTLFYADPPYMMSTRSSASVMYTHEMTDSEHIELAERLHNITGMAIVSGYPSELYEAIYGDWRKIEHMAKAQNGSPRTECIWLSPNIRTTMF